MPEILDERRYQVFVSSTFRDLVLERQKVLQAILEVQAFPSGMELFPSADDEQWEFIKREIKSSDYYVLILAGKYGSLAIDGVSFTEKEYDFALEIKKPVLSFLFHDLNELKGSQLEQNADKRGKLEVFREKVMKGKLVNFYRNEDELRAHVLHSLQRSFQLKPAEGWVRARNARRIEDLEEVNRLQKRVIELETENHRLRDLENDPSHRLARGSDEVSWQITFQRPPRSRVNPYISIPVDSFSLRITWNSVLLSCFRYAHPRAAKYQIEKGLLSQIKIELQKDLVAQGWNEEGDISSEQIAGFPEICWQVRNQFLGLGYIEIEEETSIFANMKTSTEYWKLTRDGAVHFTLLTGFRKGVAIPN